MNVPLPRGWVAIVAIHPRWKDKDGGRWHIQLWREDARGFILSSRGIVR